MKTMHELSYWFYLSHAGYLCNLGAPCGKIQNRIDPLRIDPFQYSIRRTISKNKIRRKKSHVTALVRMSTLSTVAYSDKLAHTIKSDFSTTQQLEIKS